MAEGYAYKDKYGFTHVVSDKKTADQYKAKDSDVSSYSGTYSGGYATNPQGGRVSLPIAGARDFGNINKGSEPETPISQAGDYSKYLGKVTSPAQQPAQPVLASLQAAATKATATQGAAQQTMDWQQRLNWIGSNPGSPEIQQWVQNEIARAGQVYNQKTAAGDTAGAQAAHTWANQLRDAAGVAGQYDRTTGASLSQPAPVSKLPPQASVQPLQQPPVIPWWQEYTEKTPVFKQELPYQAETKDILTQLQQQVSQPFNYDPQTDPAYQSLVDNASRTVMEQMNQKGILNSTVTRDTVAQAISPIISQLMQFAYQRQQGQIANLLNLSNKTSTLENQEYERRQAAETMAYTRQGQEYLDQLKEVELALKQQEARLKSATDRVKAIGFVDNASSIVLNVPVGTPSFEATKFAQEQLDKIRVKQLEITGAMERTQASQAGAMARTQASSAAAMARTQASNAASMDRTQYSQGQTNQRQQNALTSKRYTEEGFFDPNAYNEGAPTTASNGQGEETSNDVQTLIDQAVANGYSPEEIRGFLEEDGLNPDDYGY